MGDKTKSSEELNIDFTKIKNFLKGLFIEKSETVKSGKSIQNSDIQIDWSKLKSFFKKIYKADSSRDNSDESISIDWKKLKHFVSSYQVFLLLLIPLFLAFYLRIQPAYLPVTDRWAQETVYNAISTNIALQIDAQYPNLLDAQKNELVNRQFDEFLAQNSRQIDEQIKQQSLYFKSQMQDDTGLTYLVGIDPFYYARFARNIIEKGSIGDEIRNGRPYNNHQLAPIGKYSEIDGHSYLEAYAYKFIHFFSPATSLLKVVFYFPVILSALAAIPAFFVARKFGGNLAGVFASTLIVIHPAFLNRTVGGFADTDPYNILFPLLAVWLFLAVLGTSNLRLKVVYSVLAGFILGIYPFFWTGWWFIFNFILACLGINFLLYLIWNSTISHNLKKELKSVSLTYLLPAFLIWTTVLFFLTFLGAWIYHSSIFSGVRFLTNLFFVLPKAIVHLKSVALTKLWPNVLTTVAELNEVSTRDVISILGGKLLFYVAIIGIILVIFRNKNWKHNIQYAVFLLIWFAGTFYSTTRGVRFTLLLLPAFAVSLAIVASFLYYNVSRLFSKSFSVNINVCKVIFALLFILFFIVDVPKVYSAPLRSAYISARQHASDMNDAWWNTLTNIKETTSKTAIVSSWWDFGHWFMYIADRPVTFDGASQDTPQAHWIGRFFLTGNEKEAIGILRMLDCDGNRAFDKLYNITGDFLDAITTLKETIILDRSSAERYYTKVLPKEQVKSVLDSSHCENPPEAVVIVSEDMVHKSGVWAHFGGWNFTKAAMVNQAQLGKENFSVFAAEKLNMDSENEIVQAYQMVKALGTGKLANDWISPWPSYAGLKPAPCMKDGKNLVCGNGLVLNTTTLDAQVYSQGGVGIPKSLVYVDESGNIAEKKYPKSVGGDFTFILIPAGSGNYASQIAMEPLGSSMFTRLFYLEAHGLRHFRKMTDMYSVFGQRIIAYKVDWDGVEVNRVDYYLNQTISSLAFSENEY